MNLLACTESTAASIAAFAPVSAALYAAGTDSFSGCNPNRTIPLVNLHGADDTIEPMAGQAEEYGNTGCQCLFSRSLFLSFAKRGFFFEDATPSIESWRQAWATRDGCTDSLTAEVVENKVFGSATFETWNCSTTDPRATIQAYTVAGLGHSWPSTTGADGGVTSFNATTAVIIPFFSQFST